MSYAIVGFGKIGRLLLRRLPATAPKYPSQPRARGKLCSRCGRDRTHDHPPKKLAEAIKADIVFWWSVSSRNGVSRRRCPPGRVRPSSM
jgi:hypothetical protein